MRARLISVAFSFAALAFCARAASAQAVTGHTSLILIPTAEMPGDGVVRLSGGYIDGEHSTLPGRNDYTPYGASIGFLPFMELGFRFNRQLGEDREALGDRLILVRVQALSETDRRPALTFGAHDFLRSTGEETRKFNALYIVASKHFETALPTGRVGVHVGYGSDVIEARAHQYDGIFGGLSVRPSEWVEAMLEYDTQTANVGLRGHILDHVRVMVGLQNLDTPIAGATLQVRL